MPPTALAATPAEGAGTVSMAEAARLLGISKSHAHDLANEGRFPVPTIRLGARVVVPKAPLQRLLAGDQAPADGPGPVAGAA